MFFLNSAFKKTPVEQLGKRAKVYSNSFDGIKLNIQQRDVTDLKEFADIRHESRNIGAWS